MSKELVEIEKTLKHLDWWYSRAEGNAYRRGKASYERALAACRAAKDKPAVNALWDKYCPYEKVPSHLDGTPRQK